MEISCRLKTAGLPYHQGMPSPRPLWGTEVGGGEGEEGERSLLLADFPGPLLPPLPISKSPMTSCHKGGSGASFLQTDQVKVLCFFMYNRCFLWSLSKSLIFSHESGWLYAFLGCTREKVGPQPSRNSPHKTAAIIYWAHTVCRAVSILSSHG